MIRYTQEPAYILKRTAYREQQYLLDLLTQNHGIVRAVSRIPNQKTHRQTSLHVPFQKFLLTGQRRHELITVTHTDLAHSFHIENKNLLLAYYLNETILGLLPPDYSEPELFKLYECTLNNLNAKSLRYFEYQILHQLGLWPEIPLQGTHYQLSQIHNPAIFIASPSGYDAQLVEALTNHQWISEHPQLKTLLQAIIAPHLSKTQHSKKTALALKRLLNH